MLGRLVSSVLLLSGCGSDPGDRAAVVRQYAINLHQNYVDVEVKLEALQAAVDMFAASPSPDGLVAAQQAWLDARPLYGEAEISRFYAGPLDDAEGRMNEWPIDENFIDYTLTWLAIQRGLPLADGARLGELAEDNPVEIDAQRRVRIAGTDVTASIRKSDIDRMVPVVARQEAVRRVMRARQRELADDGDVVIEGRDIGTVVAPGADVKVYLNADRDIRARRRLSERPEIGADALATDLRLRDQSDAARMQPAEDAVQIDTTELDVEDVVDKIEELVRARQPA